MDNFQIYLMKNTLVLNSTIQHGSCDVSLSEFKMSSSNNTTAVFDH